MNRHAVVHECIALPLAEDAVDLCQIGTGVTAENFAGIGRDLREHGFALGAERGNGVGQVKLAMFVIGFDLRQRGPELFEREAIDGGIDFVDIALVGGEL